MQEFDKTLGKFYAWSSRPRPKAKDLYHKKGPKFCRMLGFFFLKKVMLGSKDPNFFTNTMIRLMSLSYEVTINIIFVSTN